MTTNKNLLRFNYTIFHDSNKIHSDRYSYTVETLAVFTKIFTYIKVKLPENENDGHFRKEVFSTVVDAEKAYKGIQNNFVTAKMFEMVKNATGFDINFPVQKVIRLLKFLF